MLTGENSSSRKGDAIFVIGKGIWHSGDLGFLHYLEGLVLKGSWLEFVVNDLQSVAHYVVLFL
jgi:hypothetical protein